MAETQDKAFGLTEKQKGYLKWVDLCKEHKFFTPGLAYWKSEVDRDIVSDFVDKYSLAKPDRPKLFTADHDIFDVDDPIATLYIGDKEFKFNIARQVYLCPLQTWPGLAEYIKGCGFFCRDTKSFYRLLHQKDIMMPDPGASRYGMMADIISMDAFCIFSNQFCNAFTQYKNNLFEMPKAKRFGASEVLEKDGELFFDGKLGAD